LRRSDLIAIARGERPAELVLRGGLIVNVLSAEVHPAEVRGAHADLIAAARRLGSKIPDPFMTLSFLGLEVVPSLKLTDLGLVDVEAFRIVDPVV
jgi:adenine deaminase